MLHKLRLWHKYCTQDQSSKSTIAQKFKLKKTKPFLFSKLLPEDKNIKMEN